MQRVAIIDGVRTPFVKAGTVFAKLSMQELGAHVLREVVLRNQLNPETIDEFTFSTVLLDPRTPNWAREILFLAELPKTVYAHSVSNNCISGLVAIHSAASRIALGETALAIAGGAESLSNPALLFKPQAAKVFLSLARARSLKERLSALFGYRPGFILPDPPGVVEPSTGLSMGQHMELTAQELKIDRATQDKIALSSHQNAAKATQEGLLTAEIAPLEGVSKDTIVRADTSLEKLSSLKPVFDRGPNGTLTAGNSSALTDGASAVVLMSEKRAKDEGREALAYLKATQYAAISPKDGLLMAPALAVPQLLRRLGYSFDDFDRIEIHEAFAAQVAANVKAWEEGWKEPAVGKFPWDRCNILGGSIAIGHPFAATGGRIITTLAREMKRHNLRRGLISICAAGAMACAMVLERDL